MTRRLLKYIGWGFITAAGYRVTRGYNETRPPVCLKVNSVSFIDFSFQFCSKIKVFFGWNPPPTREARLIKTKQKTFSIKFRIIRLFDQISVKLDKTINVQCCTVSQLAMKYRSLCPAGQP